MSSARTRLTKILNQRPPKRPPVGVTNNTTNSPRCHILRGDKVQVMGQHVEKGKIGIVATVLRQQQRAIVEGVHVVKRPIKGQPDRGIAGRMATRERSIPLSQLSLLCPVTNHPTRIVYKVLDDGTKARVAVKSGAVIPRPTILLYRKRPVSSLVTDSDTEDPYVWEITYEPLLLQQQQQQEQSQPLNEASK